MTKFLRLRYEFEAVQWTGDNIEEVREFTGVRIRPWDGGEMKLFNPLGTYLPAHLYDDCNPKPTAELWTGDHSKWMPVCIGEWIVQNDEEFQTCTDEYMRINFTMLDDELSALLEEHDRPKTFYEDLMHLLNHHSKENHSGTPDWILANFLSNVLWQFDCAVASRAKWRGESLELPALQDDHSKQAEDLPKGVEQADGKTVPLVIYTDGQRNEIGTATVNVTPGETRIEGTITAANAILAEPVVEGQYSVNIQDGPVETGSPSTFQRYIEKGLNN